ncbi:MAG: MEDS domain-containing protein [Kineosporiaceae bacterium]
MRAQGVLTEPDAALGADHICWVYDDEDSFTELAGRYLAEGLAGGERLLCVGSGIAALLRRGGQAGLDVDDLVSRGALEFLDVDTAYERTGELRPEEQLEFYHSATRRALAEGYTGLRVVAEITDLAVDAARRAELMRWESVADGFIGHGSGMRAMCAYAATRLDDEALADLTSVHPLVRAPEAIPPFRVWFEEDTITLAGELDGLGADRLGRVLAGSPVRRPIVVLDLARVEFVDVAACRTLARWAADLREQGARLVLLGTSRLFRRMWNLLGFADATGALITTGTEDSHP